MNNDKTFTSKQINESWKSQDDDKVHWVTTWHTWSIVNIRFSRSINSRRSAFSASNSPPSKSVGTLTWPMSSTQLKIYFRASLDLIPVSASCSSGVYRQRNCTHWNWLLELEVRTEQHKLENGRVGTAYLKSPEWISAFQIAIEKLGCFRGRV